MSLHCESGAAAGGACSEAEAIEPQLQPYKFNRMITIRSEQ